MTATEWTFAMIDLAGFTALTEAHGDDQAADIATSFAAMARERLDDGDRLVKPIGDAVLLASETPRSALRLVHGLLDDCQARPDFPVVRAGLHHGPGVERSGDLFGAAVNLTARIAGQAAGGQTLSTRAVADAARLEDVQVHSVGVFDLRNVSRPVELFDLRLCPAPVVTSIDPVCRMKVARETAAGMLRHADREVWFCSLPCAATFAAEPVRYATS